MKQEINPAIIAVSVVVVLCILIFIATRVLGPATPTAAPAPPPPPATINGQQIPAGAPMAAFQKAKEQAAGGKN